MPQGESVPGFKGVDTRYGRNHDYKGDTPGNLFDYKNDVIFSSDLIDPAYISAHENVCAIQADRWEIQVESGASGASCYSWIESFGAYTD